jgi:cytochrome bd-type quinol oxidase subunit 2
VDADFAVAARTRIAHRTRERERKATRRQRVAGVLLWLCAPLVLPAAGAAAFVKVLDDAGGTFAHWSIPAAAAFALAAFGLPILLTLLLARHRRRLERLAWALITLLAQVALIFWVGFVALGYGPPA